MALVGDFQRELFMEKYKGEFLKVVNAHAIRLKLEIGKVIPEELSYKMDKTANITARDMLYLHLHANATSNDIHKLCDAMTSISGYGNMNKLGHKMKSDKDLPPYKPDLKKPEPDPGFEDTDSSMSDATSDVHYVIMTANMNEWKSAQHFLGVECEVSDKVKKQKFDDDKDLKHKVQGINPDATIKGTGYSFFTVANKNAVLMKCSSMGSTAGEGSQYATFELLTMAQKRGWPLEAIFIVGCCAAISGTKETSETGSVFVANKIYYHGSGTLEDGTHKNKFDPYPVSTVHCDNLEGLGLPTIQSIKIVSMLSGDLLVKDKEAAEKRRKGLGEKRIGFEMEGFGVVKAVKLHELQQKSHKMPKVVLLKGVSDDASPDKNKSASIMFFSEKMDEVDEDTRQQMCTIMSLTVALRAICKDYV